jgi:hypothetical protein
MQALSLFLDPVTAKKIHFVKSADLPAAAVTPAADHGNSNGSTINSHPPASGGTSEKVLSKDVEAFLPYVQYYQKQYDEQAFRRLLKAAGWP